MAYDYRRILVPIDFSPPSHEAAQRALDIARRFGAEVAFLHVVDSRYADISASKIVTPPMPDEKHLRKIAEERLETFLATEGVTTSAREIRMGIPSEEILADIGELGPDLVVMGTHGRTGVKRALLGSQCEQVVRRCPVPVLVVHGPGDNMS